MSTTTARQATRKTAGFGLGIWTFRVNRAIASHQCKRTSATMSGQMIEVYSSSGCRHCRDAKRKLSDLQVPFADIDVSLALDDLDSLPSRQRERVLFTLSKSVPQIFLAGECIGGHDELLHAIDSGRFMRMLADHDMMPMACTTGLKAAEHDQWDVSDLLPMPGEALNSARFLLSDQLHGSFSALAEALHSQAHALLDISSDSTGHSAVSRASIQREYIHLAAHLPRIILPPTHALPDDEGLSASAMAAFWINLYNSMVIHAQCLGMSGEAAQSRGDFFRGHAGAVYDIGGLTWSLDDIEHGILRGNRKHPSQLTETFLDPSDPKAAFSLPFHPCVHFLLNCGAKSCPPIRIVTESNIEFALQSAARAYLADEVAVDRGTRTITLPRLLLWYGSDFGSTLPEQISSVADMLGNQLGEELRGVLLEGELPFGGYTVQYGDYDWTANLHT